MTDYSLDSDTVVLRNDDTGEHVGLWQEYSYQSEFLELVDSAHFTLGDAELATVVRPKFPPQCPVTLEINGKPQIKGYVAGTTMHAARGGSGTTLNVDVVDALGPMSWAGVDPLFTLTEGTTLRDAATRLAVPFGFKVFATSDLAGRSIVTGNAPGKTSSRIIPASTQTYGQYTQVIPPTTEVYDPTRPKSLRDFPLSQAKPHDREGCAEFLARLCKRFGLWLWASSLGDTLNIGQPDFEQDATFGIVRHAEASYLDATLQTSARDQPTVIVAYTRKIGGGKNPLGKGEVIMVNELTGLDSTGAYLPAVTEFLKRRPGAKVLPIRKNIAEFGRFLGTPLGFVPMFLKDDESTSLDQLEQFTRKEMGVRQGKALKYHVRVDGHTQDGLVWNVNTVARVTDTVAGVEGLWWCRARTLSKARGADGTQTVLEYVPNGLLEIGT